MGWRFEVYQASRQWPCSKAFAHRRRAVKTPLSNAIVGMIEAAMCSGCLGVDDGQSSVRAGLRGRECLPPPPECPFFDIKHSFGNHAVQGALAFLKVAERVPLVELLKMS